jgi:hypothetical protein
MAGISTYMLLRGSGEAIYELDGMEGHVEWLFG